MTVTLEEISTWKVEALKEFCRKRELKTTGSKQELIARVFAALEMGIEIKSTAEELIQRTKKEKAKLLHTPENITLPDPDNLHDGWIDETAGITSWPPIYLSDITIYLMADHPGRDIDFNTRILNEYKEGKAYRLFDSGFQKEVYFHKISHESEFCFLKSTCTHSMMIKAPPHTTWVAAHKNSGKISRCYCSCTAGMSGSCLHVTALLFRIEAANRNGITKPACTSKQCTWAIPPKKTVIKTKRICEMEWKAAKFRKSPKRPAVDVRRTLFKPLEQKVLTSDDEKREVFYNELKDILPDSCFIMMKKAEHQEVVQTQFKSINNKVLTKDDIDRIETKTIGQSNNQYWHIERKGRITASNFYRVFTKVETIKSTGMFDQNMTEKLVQSLLGQVKPSQDLPSLQYGRVMENVAKEMFCKIFRETHKDVSIRECGLFVHDTKQYLGASPDLLVECSCCGRGLLEIKCPSSIKDKSPSPDNLTYLGFKNDNVSLKKNHMYFAQIQGQMAITKRKFCHFFVYTNVGNYLETIIFDEKYWHELEANLSWFYENCMAPLNVITVASMPAQ